MIKEKSSVTPHIPGGMVTSEQLRQIAEIADTYGGQIKLTGSSITIMGLPLTASEQAIGKLDCPVISFTAKAVRAVALCTGKPACVRAQQDSGTLGLALDKQFFDQPLPGKLRIGISGCPNCCSEPMVKDIGLYGLPKGYTLAVGGNAGRLAKAGTIVAESVPAEQVASIIETILAWYNQHGREKERLGSTIERIGFTEFALKTIPEKYRK